MYRSVTFHIACAVVSLTILISSLHAEYVLTDRNSIKHNVVVKRAFMSDVPAYGGLRLMCEASPRDCPGGFRKRSGLLQKRKSVDETQFDAEKLFRFLLYNLRQEERRRLDDSSPLNMLGLRSNRILSQEQSR